MGRRGPCRPRTVRTVDDAHAALDAYVAAIPATVLSTAQHISTDIDHREVDEREFAAALRRRNRAGREERDIYASYLNEQYLVRLERERPGVAFQFSLGAEPLPAETASRVSQRTLAQVAAMIARHPGIRFQCFLASAHANQTLCTIARELPNFSLAGYWWHSFFPTFIARIMSERLDMLAASRQVGFFSDAYTFEWSYAKAVMVRKVLARVLAEKVRLGQYGKDEALAAARAMLYESPQVLLGMRPRAEGKAAWTTPTGGPRTTARRASSSARHEEARSRREARPVSIDVLGLGAVAVDDLVYLDEYPRPDSKVRVVRRERHAGGLTGTALVAAARMGRRCSYAGLPRGRRAVALHPRQPRRGARRHDGGREPSGRPALPLHDHRRHERPDAHHPR